MMDVVRETEGIDEGFRIMCLKIGRCKEEVKVLLGTLDAPF